MTFEQRDVRGRTGSFLVAEAGPADGPVLVFVHDEVSSQPDRLIESLASSYRVIAPVLPGFGAADRPDWVESMVDLVDHLADLTDALELPEPFTLMGSSLGGWVAAELALRLLPHQLDLVLLGPAGLRVPGHPTADHWFAEVHERQQMLYADPAAAPEVDLDEYLANEESAARYAWSPRFHSHTLGQRLARMTARTLVIWGAEDRFIDPAHADAWREAVEGADIEILEGCGHFPRYERPDDVATIVTSWLERSTVAERTSA